MMHREIRLNNLVLPSLIPANLISIVGVLLDCDLWNIKNAVENYKKNFFVNLYATMSYGCNIKVPIFITPKEREDYNKIENKKNPK